MGKEVIDLGDPWVAAWYDRLRQPIPGPLYVTECQHGIRIVEDPEKRGYIITHGENREAQKLFSDREIASVSREKLIQWLDEIHEYEGSSAVVSHT